MTFKKTHLQMKRAAVSMAVQQAPSSSSVTAVQEQKFGLLAGPAEGGNRRRKSGSCRNGRGRAVNPCCSDCRFISGCFETPAGADLNWERFLLGWQDLRSITTLRRVSTWCRNKHPTSKLRVVGLSPAHLLHRSSPPQRNQGRSGRSV